MPDAGPAWWTGSVGYQIYLRSFMDTDEDGIGDLPGITSRLDHLVDLGIDVLWITPFYPSPQADHGYDVADYLDVDATFGTLDDLAQLLTEAHARDLKVIIDLVPNHTSDQHPWFVDARAGRDAEHRNLYVWKDPAPDGGPPNNWVSHFGGPAWTHDPASGQYYMHLFLPEQPDLNWANPAVHAAFEEILTTWFERGVDGVRIDVAHSLVEDPAFRDNPRLAEPPADATSSQLLFDRFAHIHDLDQDGVLDIYRAWRAIADRYDAVLLGEVFVLAPDRLRRYLTGDGLHAGFCFAALKVPWDAAQIRDTLRAHVDASGSALAWPLSSHDDPHAATRFGGGSLGARRALAYATLLCGLPGVPFLYQGDELGLDDGHLDASVAEDPIAVRNPGVAGRDPMRTPMVWEPGPGFGFTTAEPWLPFGANRRDEHTVRAQGEDPASHLARMRALLAVRHELPSLAGDGPTDWILDDGPVIAVERDDRVLIVLHVDDGEGPAELELPERCALAYASHPDVVLFHDGRLHLPPDTAAIIDLEGADDLDEPADREGTSP